MPGLRPHYEGRPDEMNFTKQKRSYGGESEQERDRVTHDNLWVSACVSACVSVDDVSV